MTPQIESLIEQKTGVLLDVSLGGEPQANSVCFKELGHDPRCLPWPLPDNCVHTANVVHVLEYLPKANFFAWFDELHRVVRPGGLCYISGPYGGDESIGWVSDPTHTIRIVESTFAWFDPRAPLYTMHHLSGRETPKPWNVLAAARVPGTLGTISYNVVLRAAEVVRVEAFVEPMEISHEAVGAK